MNSDNRLSKDRHDRGVERISARELHVVGELVWRDPLQHQLAGICVFAFVALERDPQKSNPDCDHEAENDYGQDPPAKTQRFALDVVPVCHETCFSDEKERLATERFLLHCVFSKWRLI